MARNNYIIKRIFIRALEELQLEHPRDRLIEIHAHSGLEALFDLWAHENRGRSEALRLAEWLSLQGSDDDRNEIVQMLVEQLQKLYSRDP